MRIFQNGLTGERREVPDTDPIKYGPPWYLEEGPEHLGEPPKAKAPKSGK